MMNGKLSYLEKLKSYWTVHTALALAYLAIATIVGVDFYMRMK